MLSNVSRLEIYKSTNFSKCPADDSYTSNPEFLSQYAHFVAIISIPTNIFGFYCIHFHTPRKMKEMKLCLLHLQIWTFTFDLCYLVLLIPYLFLPLNAYGYIGLLSALGVSSKAQYFMDLVAGGGITVATLMLFENRHHNLVPSTSIFRINKPILRVFVLILNFFLGAPGLIPTLLLEHNTDEIKLEMLKIIPCPNKLFFNSHTFAFQQNNEVLSYITTFIVVFLFSEGVFYASHCVYHLYFGKSNHGMSKQVKKMQRTFFIATFVQGSIPTLFITGPTVYMAYSMMELYYNQGLMNIATLISCFHGTVATSALVFVNKPYRDYVAGIFKKRGKSTNSSSRNHSHQFNHAIKILTVTTKITGK